MAAVMRMDTNGSTSANSTPHSSYFLRLQAMVAQHGSATPPCGGAARPLLQC